ncbi:MAG: PIG-L family deacetylase [Planctomycetota bacterium]
MQPCLSRSRVGLFVCLISLIASPNVSAQIPDGFDLDPRKFDMLVVVAHPDDEGTFGGLLPYYAVCRDKKIKVMVLTSGEWGNGMPHHRSAQEKPGYSYDDSDHPRFAEVSPDALYPCYFREVEMSRVLIASGVRYAPLMPRFRDQSNLQPWGSPDPAFEFWGGRNKVVHAVAEAIRKTQPEIIVTMAKDGFNGNPQHMAASAAALAAIDVASSESAEVKGNPWTVKKAYTVVTSLEDSVEGAAPGASLTQGREDELHVHRWDLSCERLPVTAQIRAARANALHRSQKMPSACAEESKFILQHTTVGRDVRRRNDLFENIIPENKR